MRKDKSDKSLSERMFGGEIDDVAAAREYMDVSNTRYTKESFQANL